MNRLTHRQVLLAGMAVILAVNAIALAGVAWNRSVEDSRLQLSERELAAPWDWGRDEENSGVAVTLQWAEERNDVAFEAGGGDVAWLDARKLAQLGFDLRPPTVRQLDKQRWFGNQREAVAVLEFNGPAYARSIPRIETELAQKRALLAASPDPTREESVRELESKLFKARFEATRLYVIDAGLDAGALRRKYPDRHRYALMPAVLSMQWHLDKGRMRVVGYVQEIIGSRLHVSNTQAAAIAPALAQAYSEYGAAKKPVAFDVAFGRRMEPWIIAARMRAQTSN